jgi:hypothetical protein
VERSLENSWRMTMKEVTETIDEKTVQTETVFDQQLEPHSCSMFEARRRQKDVYATVCLLCIWQTGYMRARQEYMHEKKVETATERDIALSTAQQGYGGQQGRDVKTVIW